VAWSKVETSSTGQTEPSIIGHDPSPSFPFAAKVAFADSLEPVDSKAWNLDEIRAEARYAPKSVRRVGSIGAQFARFRRGDSVLVVAAYAAHDDSVRVPSITLGAATYFDTVAVSPADTVMRGHIKVMMARQPVLVGVDVSDTASGTLLRTRYSYAPVIDSAAFSVSDMLIFRGSAEQVFSLDSALARAIPGDTATRNHPVGLFWETYGIADGASLDITVSVERLDHSWIRSARQKLRLTPVDTPIRMKWNEARPSTGRAVSLDLANLDGGRYRVTLTVTQPDGKSTSSTREVELTDP
jgi:hypothetical protein